jgi:hypothetical protein
MHNRTALVATEDLSLLHGSTTKDTGERKQPSRQRANQWPYKSHTNNRHKIEAVSLITARIYALI